jgi:hypothetical protein
MVSDVLDNISVSNDTAIDLLCLTHPEKVYQAGI